MNWTIENNWALFAFDTGVRVVRCVVDKIGQLEHITRPPKLGHDIDVAAPHTDPPAGVEPPHTPPAGIPFHNWVQPAIWTALEPHEPRPLPSKYTSYEQVLCCGLCFYDWQEWREHISPGIANRIETALLTTDFNK